MGTPISNASDVSVFMTYLGSHLKETGVSARDEGDGAYVGEDSQISISGVWQAELTIICLDACNARTAFRFEAASTEAGGSALISSSPDAARALLGIGLVRLGFVFAMVAMSLEGRNLREGVRVLAPGAAVFVVGVFLYSRVGGSSYAIPSRPQRSRWRWEKQCI